MPKNLDVLEAVICPTGADNMRNSDGSILPLNDGGLLLAYTRYRGGSSSDFAPSDIVSRVSRDGGRTWSAPEVVSECSRDIMDPASRSGNMLSPSLLRLASGGIAIFSYEVSFEKGPGYTAGNFDDVSAIGALQFMKISQDEGKTWSDKVYLNPQGELGQVLLNDSALRLSTGRVLLPNYYVLSPFNSMEFVQPIFSDDDGATWRRSRYRLCPEGVPGGLSESSAVELPDGRLLMVSRTAAGFVYKSYSSDGGETWSRPEPTCLPASGTPTSLARIPGTDDVLIIWNQVSEREWTYGAGRHRLSCAITSDYGQTWHHTKNLESLDDRTYIPPEEGGRRDEEMFHEVNRIKPDARKELRRQLGLRTEGILVAEYSSLVFVGDMAVITYDVAPTPGCSLKLRILPKEWFYA